MPKTVLIYGHEMTCYDLGRNHPLRPERLRLVYELVSACGLIGGDSALVPPEPATREDLETVHVPSYIDTVKTLSDGDCSPAKTRSGFGSLDNPPFPGMYEASLIYTGASVLAAHLVVSGECDRAFNFSGGLHHAMPDRASGFCVFNDAAVAIERLRHKFKRIAYIDLDAHHGDGVQSIFYDTDEVLTISLHESGDYLFPGTGYPNEIGVGAGKGCSVNIPFTPSTPDDVYLWAFDQVVPPLIAAYQPDAIVAQLGVDTHFDDPLAHLVLTSSGFTSLVERILSFGRPVVALGGGGYNLLAVPRLWTLAYALMAGRDIPDRIPEEYTRKYGTAQLHDAVSPPISRHQKHNVRPDAEKAVAAVKRLVFPLHGLSPE